MSDFEFNKIFAAFLIAGIVAYLSAFVGDKLVHPHNLDEDAVPVDGGAVASAGPAKKKGPEPILHLIATADVAKGEKLSKACAACHSFDNGGPQKVGPNLWNIVNAKKAHIDGFAYSAALAEKTDNWNYLSLNKFIYKPKNYINGTKMNYIGLKKPNDRAAIIAWLRTLSDSPATLPSQAEIDAELAELAPPEPETEASGEDKEASIASDIQPASGEELSDFPATPAPVENK